SEVWLVINKLARNRPGIGQRFCNPTLYKVVLRGNGSRLEDLDRVPFALMNRIGDGDRALGHTRCGNRKENVLVISRRTNNDAAQLRQSVGGGNVRGFWIERA